MSTAPISVHLLFNVNGRLSGWSQEPEKDPSAVRYLRADLTCGECAFTTSDGYDPVCNNEHSQFYKDILEGDGCACMAFVPSEER